LLTDAIGKGYSSQVFRGRNDLTNQPVAIKVINMSMLKSDVHQALLTSEIECLKSLNSCPNIIQLYEVYTTKNNTYIITELCEDGDLSKLIKKKKIPEQRALQMIEHMVAGYL
jgi:serine/threonine-protein kinase ULK/ATG1